MHQREPRINAMRCDIDHQLSPLLSVEAIEIHARSIARIFNRDPNQVPQLNAVFNKAFNDESNYLRTQRGSGGPDGYHRSGAP
jgi:hypothetical protein